MCKNAYDKPMSGFFIHVLPLQQKVPLMKNYQSKINAIVSLSKEIESQGAIYWLLMQNGGKGVLQFECPLLCCNSKRV